MAYLVLAYPTFSSPDLSWIEAIRTRHDPQATLIAPHVTLVFPLDENELALDVLRTHLYDVVETPSRLSPISLMLRAALVMPESGKPGGHLFLIPDEGTSQLVKLHERLYRGLLLSHLRLDIPFVPHVTVGASNNLAALYEVAQELNAVDFAISGRIDRLTLVRYGAGGVTPVDEIILAGTVR